MPAKPNPLLRPGWMIWDTKTEQPYVWNTWPREQIDYEYEMLLRGFPKRHSWRRRLTRVWFPGPELCLGYIAGDVLQQVRRLVDRGINTSVSSDAT